MKVPIIPPVARDVGLNARQREILISQCKITGFVVDCLEIVGSESALFPQAYAFHVTRPFFRNAFRSIRKKKARV